MFHRTIAFLLLLALVSCGDNGVKTDNTASDDGGVFKSENKNGKWTTDYATAQELKSMKNTIENFTLLNKKKYENLKAYQEFGDLMQMHVDRVNTYCRLDEDSKNLLCKNINRIKDQVAVLHGNDMTQSKEAITAVNKIFSEVDSTFNY